MKDVHASCVFIADDDADDQYLLQLAFQQHSPACRLLFSQDGVDLLTQLAQTGLEPCLIILDLNMPRLNGFEALKILRSSPRYQKTPIVILTTSAASEDIRKAFALGANDYITKPAYLEQLGHTVSQLRENWQLNGCR